MNKLKELWKRIEENFKKNKVLLLIVSIAWILLVVFLLNKYKDSLGNEPYGNEMYDNVVEINKNTSIDAKIPLESDTNSVAIIFATYARNNKGNVYVNIKDSSDNELVNRKINVNSIQDNAHIAFGFNKPTNSRYVTISITSDSEKGKGVGLYYSNECFFYNSILKVNDKKIDGEICAKLLLQNDSYKKLCNQIITGAIIALSLLIIITILIKPSYEKLFTLIIIVFGLIITICMTPMSMPDEQLHYEYCFQLSNYVLGDAENHTLIDNTYARDSHFSGHHNVSLAFERIINEFNNPLELKGKYKECRSDVEGLYWIYYIPQVTAITVARILKLNMLKLFYLGRVFNLLFYSICIYIALKNTPIHKLLLGIISTLPMFIQQAASYSYDPFIIGFCFIESSFILKWMFTEEKINKKDFIVAFIVCLVLAPAKVVYGFISLLFIFVPKERFENSKQRKIVLLLLCGPASFEILYNIFLRFEYKIRMALAVHADDGTSEVQQVIKLWNIPYVLEHPFESIMIVLRTIRFQIKKWFYDCIGHTLSGQSLVIPISFVYVYIVNILSSSLIKQNHIPNIWYKISSLGVCVTIGLFTIVGMLTGWTERGAYLVDGVQGRYFCPVLPYFFTVFSNRYISLNKKTETYIVISQIFVFFATVIYILSYTFMN